MSSRGRRRAPARHAQPKSLSRFLGPIAVGAVLVLGGSAATGSTGILASGGTGSPTKTAAPTVALSATRTFKTVATVQSLKFQTKIIHDADVKKGTKILRSKGTPGKVRYTVRVTVLKGRAISRTVIAKAILIKPKAAVYIVGTGGAQVAAASAPNLAGVTGTKAGSMRFAQTFISSKYHWGNGEFGCLVSLWNRESHWRHTARNRSSGAYGIPQAMPGSKMAKFGADWQTNPNTQIKWGVNYIEKRYGTPCGALAHSNSTGWY